MEMIEIKTSELIGPALDWAVAKAEGLDCGLWKKGSAPGYCVIIKSTFFCPATKWSDCGPLFEKYMIGFVVYSDAYFAVVARNEMHGYENGPTHLIAACRAIVAAKLGDTVSVPKELMQ